MPELDRSAYGESMSDFEAALERLLTDPSFAAHLAGDPDRALSGYRLEPGESELLRSQVAGDSAADLAAVEARTTRASTFELVSALGDWAEFGSAVGVAGQPDDGRGGGGSTPSARTGLGDAPENDLDGLPAVSRMGDAPRSGMGEPGPQSVARDREIAPPKGYRNRVDADGDGMHDKATYRGRKDGGADILVDLDRDWRTDFIGHDVDLDYRVDSAEYDKNHDGVFEKRMYDDDGDGWLDRTVWQPDQS